MIDSATYPREFLNSSPRKRERERKNFQPKTQKDSRVYRELSVLRVVRRDYTHDTRSLHPLFLWTQRGSAHNHPPPNSSHFPPLSLGPARRPFSIDTPAQLSLSPPGGETDGQNRAHRQPSQRFRTRYPFSTWISPNNFGDFHPNPLMSLLTGNGQIEYPWPADPRTTRITHRCHDIAPPPPRYRLYYSVPVPGRNAPLPRVIHGCRKKKKRTRSGRLWKKRKKKRNGGDILTFRSFFFFVLFCFQFSSSFLEYTTYAWILLDWIIN